MGAHCCGASFGGLGTDPTGRFRATSSGLRMSLMGRHAPVIDVVRRAKCGRSLPGVETGARRRGPRSESHSVAVDLQIFSPSREFERSQSEFQKRADTLDHATMCSVPCALPERSLLAQYARSRVQGSFGVSQALLARPPLRDSVTLGAPVRANAINASPL